MHKHLHHRTFFFWEISQINACHCSQQNKHFWELCSFSLEICICIFFYSIGFAKEAFYTCKNNRNASVNSSRAQHQPPTPPPPGYCGAFAHLVSPRGGAFPNFVLPGGRAFANPAANPKLLTRTRFRIRI